MMLRKPDQGLWWSSVTGMLEDGETLEAAAHRELLEETGLTGKLVPLGFSHAFWVDPRLVGLPAGEPSFNTEACFHVEVPASAQVKLGPEEHSEYRWCSIPEARELMLWEGSRHALGLLERQLAAVS